MSFKLTTNFLIFQRRSHVLGLFTSIYQAFILFKIFDLASRRLILESFLILEPAFMRVSAIVIAIGCTFCHYLSTKTVIGSISALIKGDGFVTGVVSVPGDIEK